MSRELGAIHPGAHRYQVTRSERPDNPNLMWCGDITYVWAGNRWNYLETFYFLAKPDS